jgi:hypothetical protein
MSLRERARPRIRVSSPDLETPVLWPKRRLEGPTWERLMQRRSLILGVIATSCFGIRRASAWPLVTRQQLQRENAAPHNQTAPAQSRSGAPTIRIDEPDIANPVRSPVNIRISFQAAANARIAVDSLRVRYGSLGIDITRRILAHARPTQSGVFVEDAELPRGRHRVTIQIADNMGRTGTKSFNFNVV